VVAGSAQTLGSDPANWILSVPAWALSPWFLLLALGDISVAPVLLLAGYLGLIPWALLAAREGEGGGGPGQTKDGDSVHSPDRVGPGRNRHNSLETKE